MNNKEKQKFNCPKCTTQLPMACVYTKIIDKTEFRELIYYCKRCCQVYIIRFDTGELIKTLPVKI